MSIFGSSVRVYPGGWSISGERHFTAEEIAEVKSVSVVPSQYGLSACFLMKRGGKAFIPMSNDASVAEGDVLDINSATLLTLSREGEADILRVRV